MSVVTGGERDAGLTVTVRRRELVAAALPLLAHRLPLSNLDLLLPTVDVGVFFCYKNAGGATPSGAAAAVAVLRKSLAQVLVTYYPFAGEVVTNPLGEPEVLCNNRGAEFTIAAADVELRRLNFYNPDESVEGKLVPKKRHGVLSVQVTELRCGGLLVGCTFDHRIADAHSANMFLLAWARRAQPRLDSPPPLPSLRRSLLNPRRPGHFDRSIADMYAAVSSLPAPEAPSPSPDLFSRMYYVTAEKISELQSLAAAADAAAASPPTKLESFTALLWKLVAESCTSGEHPGKAICKMGVVVDGRLRIAGGGGEMASYFGNVLSIPFGAETATALKERSLEDVAAAVHGFVEAAATEEHFRGLIDWVEAQRPDPVAARIYCDGGEEGPALVVSSGRRFPVAAIDFGWGGPAVGWYHFPWGGGAGLVMPMPSPARDGDWVVYVHVPRRLLEVFEELAGEVLRPLSAAYLGLI